MDFAERLGLWVNAFDAMALQAAHQSIGAIKPVAPGTPSGRRPPQAQAIADDFQRVRAALANAIAQDPLALGNGRFAPPAPEPLDAAPASYAPYRQRHLKLQHEMALMIAPLRDHVRQTVSRVSPRLRQLAALDAVFEHQLAPREQMLLPTAAALMKRRFEQLRLAHRQALKATAPQGEPCLSPTGWLDVFLHDWRQTLLAELDLRLEPVAGLIDALNNELKNQA